MPKPLIRETETNLWEAIRKDDLMAFNALFNLYWARLYKTAYRYLKDREESEEAVHDVFLSIWNRRHHLVIHSFPEFLLTAVRYQIYNRMRSAKLHVVSVSDCSTIESKLSYLNEGEERLQELELEKELHQYLAELPKRCQEIFHLSRIEHCSNDEIASRLGISKRTVENQITLALKHLRVSFKDIGLMTLLLLLLK
jgi:RNA polymerase sigma-70 factor (ECF subfamily)